MPATSRLTIVEVTLSSKLYRQSRLYTHVYLHQLKLKDNDELILLHVTVSSSDLKNLGRICVSCGVTFIPVVFFVILVVHVGSIGPTYILFRFYLSEPAVRF